MTAKRPSRRPASRRVTWPVKGQPNDEGEFRLTYKRLAAIVGALVALGGAVPAYWTISDHWMNRAEVKDLVQKHSDHDNGVQMWNQYGFAVNRLDYLDDKAAECDAKKMTQPKLAAADAAMCARYEAKQQSKAKEAADLKAKAMEATKEKS
jgi:hypothetical protein